jgi:hypothetical protein
MGLWGVQPRRDTQCRVFLQVIARDVVLYLVLSCRSTLRNTGPLMVRFHRGKLEPCSMDQPEKKSENTMHVPAQYQLKGELETYLAAAIRIPLLECLGVSPKVLQDCVVAGPVPIVVCLLPQHLVLVWVCVALEFQGLHHKRLQRKNSTTCQVGGCANYNHNTMPQTSTRP